MPVLDAPASQIATQTRAEQGAHRAAVLLTALGMEHAARVLSYLDEDDVDTLIQAMTRLGYVSVTERDQALAVFEEEFPQFAGGVSGGPEFTRRLLEQAVGPDQAARLLDRALPSAAAAAPTVTLETILRDTPAEALIALVADESPQTIALVANQLALEKAATFLAALPEALQGSVTARLVAIEEPAPRAVEHLERLLVEKVGDGKSAGKGDADEGPRRVADILGRMRRSVETGLVAMLEEQSPDLARRVNKYRFTFENLLQQDDRTLQRVLRETDAAVLPLVVKGLDEAQQEMLFRNMSERAAERLREDVENLGPVRLRDVEAGQQAMVTTAKTLQERGEVNLTNPNAAEEGEQEEAFV